MKILVAEDDPVSRRVLEANLAKWGYDVLSASEGLHALQLLQRKDPPELTVLDWMMPGMDGLEICRKVREGGQNPSTYIILLTARDSQEDVVRGLEAGADDYMTKPFDHNELRARVQVGKRIVELEMNLAKRVQELEDALARVKRLQGLLPICAYCKRIRNDRNYWQQVEGYISERSEAEFSHGICPDCYEKVVKQKFERKVARGENL